MENKPISEIIDGGELYHYNHNHDALGRFASSISGSAKSVGRTVSNAKKKLANNPTKVLQKKSRTQKSAEAKENVTKKEKTARQRKESLEKAIRTGDAKTIYERRAELTDKQLDDAIKRLSRDKELKSMVAQNSPSRVKKLNEIMDKAGEYNDVVKKGLEIYKTASDVKNIINKNQSKIEREERNKQISDIVEDTTRLAELYSNRKDYSKESIEKAVKKYEAEQKLKKVLDDQSKVDVDYSIDSPKESTNTKNYSEKKVSSILDNKSDIKDYEDLDNRVDVYFESEVKNKQKRRNKRSK